MSGRILFNELFSRGRGFLSEKEQFRAVYLFLNSDSNFFSAPPFVQFAPVVPKKCGKAFWRNRVKRLLKEAYRYEKAIITEECKAKNRKLLLIMMPVSISQKKTPGITLQEVQPYVSGLLQKIKRIV
ncbi:MAG: ribonuclease P protein component [Ignavibacteriales bacterium]|nr:ribonuclease P protein component [Ignavibacteriales bacterium]